MWIPHQTWLSRGGITRDKHFIKYLKKRHEIHVIQHSQPYENKISKFFNPNNLFNSLKDWTVFKDGIYHHHLRHLYFTRFNAVLKLNNFVFKKKIYKIVKDFGIEIIICGPNHYLHGFPPFNLSIPFIFDYLDFLHDFKKPNKENTAVINKYYENADKILCVSKTILENIKPKWKEKVVYLPNGVDLNFYKSFKYSNNDKQTKYISLIGLNISESLFYLDIFPKIREKIDDVKLLLVGGGVKYPIIKNYINRFKDKSDFILTGFIPYHKIREYFYKTDVGLYPTLQNLYYHSACPLKIFEYTAALKPVVSTDLMELRKLNFPNVYLAEPTAEDFIEKIIQALNHKSSYPDLNKFDWVYLSKNLEKIITDL